jgi:hypothetical protein
MRTYCTLFDVRYLARGLALYHSLVRCDSPFEFWVLCLDTESRAVLERLALPGVQTLALFELEAAEPALLDVKPLRTPREYYFTLTSVWAAYVLARSAPDTWVAYVDADLFFYSSPEPIFDALASASVGIVPHRFPERDRHLERFGRYNVGLVVLRHDEVARSVVADWRVRCLDWCYERVDESGERFADQKYLDDWQARFPGVKEIEHTGAGLAPWNWMAADIDVTHEPPRVDGEPLIFYHFHRFRFVGATSYATGLAAFSRMPARTFQRLYGEYARELLARSTEAGVLVERDPLWRMPRSMRELRQLTRWICGMLPGNTGFRIGG